MKAAWFAVGLLAAGLAQGQATAPFDVTLAVQGSFLGRGRTVPVSINIGEKVTDLAHIRVSVSWLWAQDHMAVSYWSLFSSSPNEGDLVFKPGTLVAGLPGLKTISETVGTLDDGTFGRGGGPYGIDSMDFTFPPIDGPGEIAQYMLYASQYGTLSPGSTPELAVSIINMEAFDANGIPLRLSGGVFGASLLCVRCDNPTPVPTDFRLFGDVNKDGKVDIADVALLLKGALGLVHLTDAQRLYGDVSPTSLDGKVLSKGRYLGDGNIDVRDAITLLRLITGYWKYWWPDPLPGM